MIDIALSAFLVFFTQSLFQISKMPTDNYIRTIIDKIDPNTFMPLFRGGFERVMNSDYKKDFTVLGSHISIALDGVQHCSSNPIFCENCNYKKHKNGETQYFHSFLESVLCTPNIKVAIPLESELVTPFDTMLDSFKPPGPVPKKSR